MRSFFGLVVIITGMIGSGFFFSAGSQLSESGEDLTSLSSVGGKTVSEAYYQEIGHYGIAYAHVAYALGLVSLSLTLGVGGVLLIKSES